jgi:hypothetical protein
MVKHKPQAPVLLKLLHFAGQPLRSPDHRCCCCCCCRWWLLFAPSSSPFMCLSGVCVSSQCTEPPDVPFSHHPSPCSPLFACWSLAVGGRLVCCWRRRWRRQHPAVLCQPLHQLVRGKAVVKRHVVPAPAACSMSNVCPGALACSASFMLALMCACASRVATISARTTFNHTDTARARCAAAASRLTSS